MSDPRTHALLAAVAEVDVIDVAGAIIANPDRAKVSTAAQVALALFSERAWAVCLEADLLARAIHMPAGDTRDYAIAVQAERVSTLMAALRGETPKENEDGSSHS
ncbi:MAG: hypothetical protein ABIF45_17550 [Pseudomonadota bacterium]